MLGGMPDLEIVEYLIQAKRIDTWTKGAVERLDTERRAAQLRRTLRREPPPQRLVHDLGERHAPLRRRLLSLSNRSSSIATVVRMGAS